MMFTKRVRRAIVQDQVRVRPLHQALLGFQPCRFRQIYGVPAPSGFRCRARSMNREALIGTLQLSQDADECASCTVCRYEASSASAPKPCKSLASLSNLIDLLISHQPSTTLLATHILKLGGIASNVARRHYWISVAFSYTVLPFVLLAAFYTPLVNPGCLSSTASSVTRPWYSLLGSRIFLFY